MPFTKEDIRKEYDRLDAITGINTKELTIEISTSVTPRLKPGACSNASSDWLP